MVQYKVMPFSGHRKLKNVKKKTQAQLDLCLQEIDSNQWRILYACADVLEIFPLPLSVTEYVLRAPLSAVSWSEVTTALPL